jgi:hypothetical protein
MHKIQPLPFIGLTILLGLMCGLLLYLGLMLSSIGQWEQLSAPEKAVEIVTYSYPGLIVRSSTKNILGCDEQSKVCKGINSWSPGSMLSWGLNPCESSRLSVPLAPGEVIDHIELNYCYDGTNGQLDFVILKDGSIWRWSKQGRTIDEVPRVFALGSLGALVGGITGAVILKRRNSKGSQTLT